ncbi:von Willebrand factor type A domain-containing protein [Luteolibacter sp. GHJ8]|uniref:von Willebrand factor type A domain-containing protein n=1 Tax=Luteolibacter rhizosphaerae TaxID=2989719 RepID=A0ABT3FXN6_9BACT|nr:von Willebrand factor type A domain-containing protein [Luteolibacter rhizosphaerae]MCW1912334.1 von Willebrand factor type A domain-containing protein [Luteolibacter rhizosphaerae]
MNIGPDDPRLSAWVLGELPAAEAAAVRTAVAADPALQQQVAELRQMSEFLGSTLATATLRPDQRETVRRTAAANVIAFPAASPVASRKPGRRIWPLVLSAAAALAFAAYLAPRPDKATVTDSVVSSTGKTDDKQAPTQPYTGPRISTLPTAPEQTRPVPNPAPMLDYMARDLAANSLPDPTTLPPTAPLPAMRNDAEIGLPLLVGRDSYNWVRGWIREKNELPPKDAVRIEELANAFPLPADEETREFAGLKVACVSMPSPWSGAGRLVGVQIANESGQARQVEWSFSPAPGARQGGVRVLASTGGSGNEASDLPSGRRTLVLIELASATDTAGDLVVSAAGRSKRFPALEAKDPALQQAGLLAAFGIWLRGEGIDDSRLATILAATEKNGPPASSSPSEWADSRRLVREALDIAARKK